MNRRPLTASLCAVPVLAGLAALSPAAALVAALAMLGLQGFLTGLHIWTSVTDVLPRATTPASTSGAAPVFSVHVAIHDEPPAVVCDTLEALARQHDAPDHEVIVLDNNTADPAVWQPVADWCAAQGAPFRFFHREDVVGAKAGALNIALGLTDPRATHVVVVDADYRATPDFLASAAEALAAEGADFVQFRQAYHSEALAGGVTRELADYFSRHARVADGANAMLLTGTLSVIGRQALDRVGGWSGATLTEDAELGLRLRGAGYHGRLDMRVRGRGLLPLDFAALEVQRYRWAAGNIACLRGVGQVPRRSAMHTVAQLTAWANLGLPAAAILAGGWLRQLWAGPDAASDLAMALTGLCLTLAFVGAVLPLVVLGILDRAGASTVAGAVVTRIALLPASARGTLDGLAGTAGTFRRTPKVRTGPGGMPSPAVLSAGILGLAMLALPEGPPLALFGAALLTLPLPCALGPAFALSTYRHALTA